MSALTEYNPTEAALGELRHLYADVVFDLTTTKGEKEARAARKELVTLRTSLEAKRKELKAPALERAKLIDTEAKRIEAAILDLEGPIDAQIKADEARREAERQAKAKKEAERIARHQASLDALRSITMMSVGAPSVELANTIKMLRATEIDDDWEEFQPIAQRAKDDGLAMLADLYAKAVAAEDEAKRLAAERAELERLRAEQAKREREAAEQAAAIKRQQEAEAAATRAKIEAEQKAAREAIEAAERESRRKIEDQERAARHEREAAEAKAKAEREAEESRLRAERQRLEDEQRAASEVARKAREAEEARQLAERRDRERLLHGREMLQAFVEGYADDDEFAAIIPAIREFLAPAMQEAA